jgi:hypothetical protein
MKYIRKLSYGLLTLAIVVLVSSFAILNNDTAFKKFVNLLLNSTQTKVHKIVNIAFTGTRFTFSEAVFDYNGDNFDIKNLSLQLGEKNNKTTVHSLAIDTLNISMQGNNENSNNDSFQETYTFNDFLPSSLIKKYSGLNIWISQLTISHPNYLKNTISIHDISLENGQESLTLGFSPVDLALKNSIVNFKNNQTSPKALFTINNDNSAFFSIYFSDNEYIKLSSNVAENTSNSDKVLIKSKGDIQLSNTFYRFLSNNIKYSENIKYLNCKVSLTGVHQFPSQISNGSEFISMLSNEINLNIHSKIDFKELAFKSLELDSVLKVITQSDGFSVDVVGSQGSKLTLHPQESFSTFKETKNAAFLAKKPIHINIPAQSRFKFTEETYTLSKGTSLTWASTNDPAFVDFTLNKSSGSFSSIDNFTLSSSYDFNGRWSKYFASEHQGFIKSSHKNKQFLVDFNAEDKSLSSALTLKTKYEHDKLSANYQFHFNKNPNQSKRLNKLISYWNKDIKVLKGSVKLAGSLTNNNFLKPKSITNYQFDINAIDLKIDYDDIIISKTNSLAHFKGTNSQLQSTEEFLLTIKNINAGILIEDFSVASTAHFNLEGASHINFRNLQASALGGSLYSKDFILNIPYNPDINLQQPYDASLIIDLKKIELKKALALAENPEIEGNGLLYGQLPLFMDENLTLITGGWVKNSTPGTLRYRPDSESRAMLKQNPNMKLLLDVLGHLDYKILTADIDLDNSGVMYIKTHLQGINPDYKKGYPIIFNPNIELDFIDMMKSLQISDNINNSLSERFK